MVVRGDEDGDRRRRAEARTDHVQDRRHRDVVGMQPFELPPARLAQRRAQRRIVPEAAKRNGSRTDVEERDHHARVRGDELRDAARIGEAHHRDAALRGLQAHQREWVLARRQEESVRGGDVAPRIRARTEEPHASRQAGPGDAFLELLPRARRPRLGIEVPVLIADPHEMRVGDA